MPSTVKIRVVKAAGGGGQPALLPSQQLEPDLFKDLYGEVGLVKPPYSFEQLSILAEMHPVHGAAIEQKASDILGRGPDWERRDATDPSDEQKKQLDGWLAGLERDATLSETLEAMLQDYETFGWGILEVIRDLNSVARALVHVPAQTVRAHIDRKRLVQIVGTKRVWFRRWGAYDLKDQPILSANGNRAPASAQSDKWANDLLVFKKPSRRSSVYGVPGYVSAIGHIAMSLAARDYNVSFFGNAREPRYMLIVEGTVEEDVDKTLDTLEEQLSTQHAQPHRNLLMGTIGNTKVRIEKLTDVGNDEHFTRLTETADSKILIAHRIPADRLGAVARGTLGGSVTKEISQVYRDAVISPTQQTIADRLNKFVKVEAGIEGDLKWELAFDPLDLSDEAEDVKTTVDLLKVDAITIDEGRERLGYPPMAEGGDVTLSVYLKEHGAAAAVQNSDSSRVVGAVHERLDEIDNMLHRAVAVQALHEEEPHAPAPRTRPAASE